MKSIKIVSQYIPVKDYYCSYLDEEIYIKKDDGKLWLYINITDDCNANCPFCVNKSNFQQKGTLSLEKLERTLVKIKEHVYGVSITGGEPMLYPDLVDEVAFLVQEVLDDVTITLVTNGTNLKIIPELQAVDCFESIHVSRHSYDDTINQELMGFKAPLLADVGDVIQKLLDPAKIVFNCVMQKRGVNDKEAMKLYLDAAIMVGVRNTSFVGFLLANDYCKENYISPASIDLANDSSFNIWNRFKDYNFCSCSSGNYTNEKGSVRYYYRCPGQDKADYMRQLVYTANDKLLLGFGGQVLLDYNDE